MSLSLSNHQSEMNNRRLNYNNIIALAEEEEPAMESTTVNLTPSSSSETSATTSSYCLLAPYKSVILHSFLAMVLTVYMALSCFLTSSPSSGPTKFSIYLCVVFVLYELYRWRIYERTLHRYVIDPLCDIFQENMYRDIFTALVSCINLAFIVYLCTIDLTRLYSLGSSVGLVVISVILNARKRIHWSCVVRSLNLHYALAITCLYCPWGRSVIIDVGDGIVGYLRFSEIGGRFIYGHMLVDQFIFAFYVMTALYLSLMTIAILKHFGFFDVIVAVSQKVAFATGIAPIEGVFGIVNIFLSMTEVVVTVRQCLDRMTRSQIFSLLVTGMASVSITALFGYVNLGADVDYLVTASIVCIPLAFALSKIYEPDAVPNEYSPRSQIRPIRNMADLEGCVDDEVLGAGDNDDLVAKASAAPATLWDKCSDSIVQAGYVIQVIIGNLIALMSFMGAIDYTVALIIQPFWTSKTSPPPGLIEVLSLGLSYILPVLGIDSNDSTLAAEMMVKRVLINEFNAYQILGDNLNRLVSHRTVAMMNVMLCGFGNVSAAGMLSSMISTLTEKRVNASSLVVKALFVSIIVNIYCACTVAILDN